jgi:hypothetical protein
MIKNWNLFKESVDSESKIREICNDYDIENYTINDDFSIDVNGDVYLSGKGLTEVPLNFKIVYGNFNLGGNRLSSLIGSPDFVSGYFSCHNNRLSSLEFCPGYIGGNFHCYNNKITSLEFGSKYIGGIINCKKNKIWTFKGIPDDFRGNLYCSGSPIVEHIWNLFESSKDIEFFNDCHIIREPEHHLRKPIVVLERLNFFLDVIGKPTVEKVDGYINI